MQETINDINRQLRLAGADHFDLPEIEVPEAEADETATRQGLVSFDDDWITATRALKTRKAYE
jgi:hypothetical protein